MSKEGSGNGIEQAPSAATLSWASHALDGAELSDCLMLPGGSATHVWRLSTAQGNVIVKQSLAGADLEDAALIDREHRVLDALRPLGLPVATPFACDRDGSQCGLPTMLMSVLPGRLLDGPPELRAAIPAMAACLASIQQRCGTLLAGRQYHPWYRRDAKAPTWSSSETLWTRALGVGNRFPVPAANSFVHRDPHPANLLFEADGDALRVSGVLDWPHAGRGPAGIDGSRMAMNLACLLGLDAALEFRGHFEAARELRQDPLLDVLSVLECLPDPDGFRTWSAVGVSLTPDTVRGRLERFLEDAMRRMTTRRVT
ncbi:MAG TPA: aminoglycoside phosphotransferase family protein [Pseudomonadales bacterium]|nr:aminoglycoside phosphotransferase family protein [Pseudomonadales bacterium]